MKPQRTAAEIVAEAKARGLIAGPGKNPVRKDGEPVTAATSATGTAKWVDVTPVMAKAWLENNFRNRPLSEDVVMAYARDMANGQWVPTHQGIAFNDEDDLIDGQHRLHAIVRSGVTVRMMVTFGLKSRIAGKEMTTMDAVDRGRTRSVADQLKIQHGMKDGSAIAQVCVSLGALCYGERTRRLSDASSPPAAGSHRKAEETSGRERASLEPGITPGSVSPPPVADEKTPVELLCELTDRKCCPRCRCCEMFWEECEQCGGEGESEPGELYDEDPMYYDRWDTRRCDWCRGKGGHWTCSCDENGKHGEGGQDAN